MSINSIRLSRCFFFFFLLILFFCYFFYHVLFLSQFFVLCSILAHISFCTFLSGHITLNASCSVVPLLNRFCVSIYDKFANRFRYKCVGQVGSVTFEEVFSFVSTPPLSRDYLNVKDKTLVLFEPFSRESLSSHWLFFNERNFNVNLLPGNQTCTCVRVCGWL